MAFNQFVEGSSPSPAIFCSTKSRKGEIKVTVKELRDKLEEYSDDLEVLVIDELGSTMIEEVYESAANNVMIDIA